MAEVAAFDFDGTLTESGSVFAFLSAVAGRKVVVSASMSLAPQLVRAAFVSGTDADRVKERLFVRVLGGVSVKHLHDVAAVFGEEHLASHLRPDVRNRWDWHRRRGDKVVIVSASPEAYVSVAGSRLGADAVIATRLEVSDGTMTGRYEGANCRGDEKLRRLRQWVDQGVGPPDRLWAYGNSRGDLTMLRGADVGVNVGRLGCLGRLRDFPTLDRASSGELS